MNLEGPVPWFSSLPSALALTLPLCSLLTPRVTRMTSLAGVEGEGGAGPMRSWSVGVGSLPWNWSGAAAVGW